MPVEPGLPPQIWAVVQAGIAASSALLAVFLTQHFAARMRREGLFDRLFDHHFAAYSAIHLAILELRHDILSKRIDSASTEKVISVIKQHSLFLDDEIVSRAYRILEACKKGDAVDEEIVTTIEQLRKLAGVTQLRKNISIRNRK